MSKSFQYKSGYIGTVSDDVAKILEKKGEGKIVSEKAKPEPKKPAAQPPADPTATRKALEAKAVAAGLGTAEEVAKLDDAALNDLVKDKA